MRHAPWPRRHAREQIDRMLEQAGWAVQDARSVNLYASQGVAIREFELKSGYGTAEYLLCNSMDLTPIKFRGEEKKDEEVGRI
jgi:type I site-specific restriction endonuclease